MAATRPTGALKYEVALRAIGQDLSRLPIEFLEIAAEGNAFVVKGRCIRSTGDPKSRAGKRIQQLLHRLASITVWKRAGDERSLEGFRRRYTKEEIQVLDMLGSARQSAARKIPDASSHAESLRTVGRVVDAKNGRLLKLSKDARKITFAYKDENDQTQLEEFYSLSVYKTQQQAVALRKK